MTTVQTSQLPLGWAVFPPQPQDIARELLGLLLTTFAISLGAPFWFDALSKLVNVRISGPVSSANAETDSSRSK
jgi:hypothetical protein